mgnify:CR=1
TIDAGSAVAADTLCLTAHNLSTAGATVSVEYSATGAWAGEEVEALAGFTPADDGSLMKLFASATAQYWRLKIVSASVVPEIAIAML